MLAEKTFPPKENCPQYSILFENQYLYKKEKALLKKQNYHKKGLFSKKIENFHSNIDWSFSEKKNILQSPSKSLKMPTLLKNESMHSFPLFK